MALSALQQQTSSLNDPAEILEVALNQTQRAVVTTSFGPLAAATLHLATRVKPDIPVLWVDSGYNTSATYRFAADLIERLNLNMKIYVPTTTTGFRAAVMSGVPSVEDPAHKQFTQEVKIEPFERALTEMQPDLWITGIRAEETEHRRTLGVVSEGRQGITRIAPFFHQTEAQVQAYIDHHKLPSESRYFDPTKAWEGRECGLHY